MVSSEANQGNDRRMQTHDVSRGEHKHGDHGVLDHLVRGLSRVIEHEQTYHEKREIYAWKFQKSQSKSAGANEGG